MRGTHALMWDRFVDTVTLAWLGIFVADLTVAQHDALAVVLISVLPVYVLDLGVRYRRSGTLGRFVREHWFSILMVIPYLRVLRLFRLLRLLRLLRVLRIGRLLRIVGALR